jgi:carboxyl-terminal processing protease
MTRRILLVLLFPLLVLPASLAGQGGPSPTTFEPNQPGAARQTRAQELSAEQRVFLAMMEMIENYSLAARGDTLLWQNAMEAAVASLGDPYATILPPDDAQAFEEQSTGNYAGIGISILQVNSSVTITEVFRDAPADLAGLLVGDRIVGVNSDMSGSDGWTVNDASSRIRGEAGTMVTVVVERDGVDRPIPHEIRRDRVHVPAARQERLFGDIGYILLDRVTRNSWLEVDAALRELSGVRGLILDLRGNPGGYLDESLNLADLFVDEDAVLVRTRYREVGTDRTLENVSVARMPQRFLGVPMIVLVDAYSASAAEIIAGALQDHDRALVIGERTFGKGTVQSVLALPDDYLLRITSGEWYTPQGRSLNRRRDLEGNLIEGDSTSNLDATVSSVGGRPLRGDGGVFPDLVVLNDTLTAAERDFVAATIDAEITLGSRIQEVALQTAIASRSAGTVPERFPQARFDAFVASLIADGVPAESITEEARNYLKWRLETVLYQRLDRDDRSFEVQSERDVVLSTAIRFLQRAEQQADLFSQATREVARAPTGTRAPSAD